MGLQVEPSVSNHGTEPSPPSLFRICAIVVMFNPPSTFVANIVAVAAQVDHVVVVDNGSSAETQQQLREVEMLPKCDVIRNHQNLGIAAGLNRGIECAIKAGFKWVATFDQDSRVSEGYISQMMEAYRQVAHPQQVALIAPICVDRESGVPIRMSRSRDGNVLLAMTSGSIMPIDTIQDVGKFDESLFMDYVDVEFCLRIRKKGMRVMQSPAVLFHTLGRTTYHRVLGLNFGVTNHSAGRRYYITRNRLLVLKRYATDWPWIWRESCSILLDAFKIVLVEDNKWDKVLAMVSGTIDALLGKVGKQIEL